MQNPNGFMTKGWKQRWFELAPDSVTYREVPGSDILKQMTLTNVKNVRR